jgi:signal transduction histidine kinase
MTVVAGYLRMLLKERAGPISEQQRRLLEEAERSCGRLSALLSEVSDLLGLEAGTASFNRSRLNLRAVLRDSVAALPELPDRIVAVELATGSGECTITGDAARLTAAFTAVIAALRRELVTSDRLFVHEHSRRHDGLDVSWIAVGDAERIATLSGADNESLTTFDEWRGGVGLSLAIARRIINAHNGTIWSPVQESKAGAVVVFPQSDPHALDHTNETAGA